jgi:hypothetical protein
LVTDGQAGQGFMMMINTHTGNEAIFGSLKEVSLENLFSPTSIYQTSFKVVTPLYLSYHSLAGTPLSQHHHHTTLTATPHYHRTPPFQPCSSRKLRR